MVSFSPSLPKTPEFVTAEFAANMLSVQPNTIRRWVRDGKFPKPLKISRRCVRFRTADVHRWMDQQLGATH